MAYTTVKKSTSYVTAKELTANQGGNMVVTGVGFQPDMVWLKARDLSANWKQYDAVRGVEKEIRSNTSGAEEDNSNGLTAFSSDGFTWGIDSDINYNNTNPTSWAWKAGTTSGITTNGSTTITPSSYSFNQSAGISIVKYTGNATAGAKVAHGLGAVPGLIFVKVLDTSNNWAVYHKEMGADNAMYLDQDTGKTDDPWMNDTAPDNVNFTLSGGNYGNTANAHVAYCFSQVDGFSSFGKYTGNGNTDGKFCYTGFKPAIVLCKRTNGTSNWGIFDNKRDPLNTVNKTLFPNSDTTQDSSTVRMDFLSNGFKHRTTDTAWNGSGDEYIWIAFAAEPLVGDNPATGY
jgi:hypothetical protein